MCSQLSIKYLVFGYSLIALVLLVSHGMRYDNFFSIN